MGAAPRLGPAAPDDAVILDDDTADRGVGPCLPQAPRTERERVAHVGAVRLGLRAHSSAAPSGRSSDMNLSKSPAAWKLR
ncbi:hypothetical protein GALL_548540 [mine drainage metagenome]|uniref:Uncharacterized protein n=1 Tax=mine drainage metagenome TaxID=410659 RepID=A0A1J5PEE1_9ZZZZ